MHVLLIRSRTHCEILEAAEEGPGHASLFAFQQFDAFEFVTQETLFSLQVPAGSHTHLPRQYLSQPQHLFPYQEVPMNNLYMTICLLMCALVNYQYTMAQAAPLFNTYAAVYTTALCDWTKGSIIRQYRKPKKSIAAICAMASLKWRFF